MRKITIIIPLIILLIGCRNVSEETCGILKPSLERENIEIYYENQICNIINTSAEQVYYVMCRGGFKYMNILIKLDKLDNESIDMKGCKITKIR